MVPGVLVFFMAGVLVYWAMEGRIRWSVAALLIAPILPIGIFTHDLRTGLQRSPP
jgi:hypothetical protein